MRCHKFYNCIQLHWIITDFLTLKYVFVLVFTPCPIVSVNVRNCLKRFRTDYVLFHLFDWIFSLPCVFLICLCVCSLETGKFTVILFGAQYFMGCVCFWNYYTLCVFHVDYLSFFYTILVYAIHCDSSLALFNVHKAPEYLFLVYWSLLWARLIQSTPSRPFYLGFILILSFHLHKVLQMFSILEVNLFALFFFVSKGLWREEIEKPLHTLIF